MQQLLSVGNIIFQGVMKTKIRKTMLRDVVGLDRGIILRQVFYQGRRIKTFDPVPGIMVLLAFEISHFL